ncbi:MAG: nodulation protein NfeD [Candidatus Limnocylindrales bacterium]
MNTVPYLRRPSPLALVRSILLLIGALSLLASTVVGQEEAPAGRKVIVLPTSGVVDQIMSEYLRSGIDRAVSDGAVAVVIELDTPGGSLDSTRAIVRTQLSAEVPVLVWVGPAGARAASAGTFITLAAHVASMAPATNIGAATPINSDGSDIAEDLGEKVMNDTIATITSIAEERGRPVDWAVSTVTEALSFTVDEALAAGAIDIKAESIEDLLVQADGTTVDLAGEPVVLETAGAEIERLGMNPFQSFLHLLSDPNIAFILFTLGFYGIFFELQNPNYVTGILGAFALILAFIGFGSLPLNIAGLLLIGLAVVLFVLELTVTSGGLLTIGGLVAFALGASALYTEPGDPTAPEVAVDPMVIVVMTVATGLFMAGVLYAVMRTQRSPSPVIGQSHLQAPLLPLGTAGEVRSPLGPTGTIYAAGEEWTARGDAATRLERGTPVRVTGNDGMVLLVEPMRTSESTEGMA